MAKILCFPSRTLVSLVVKAQAATTKDTKIHEGLDAPQA